MKRLVEFALDDGKVVLAEVEVAQGERLVPAASDSGGVAGKASKTFQAALETVKPVAAAIAHSLAELPFGEIKIEFGITLRADAGAFLASAGTEAHFKVTLTRKPETGRSRGD